MVTRVAVLAPSEKAGLDPERLDALFVRMGPVAGEDALGQHRDLDYRPEVVEEPPLVPQPTGADPIRVRGILGRSSTRSARGAAEVAVVEVALVVGRLLVDCDDNRLIARLLGLVEHLRVRNGPRMRAVALALIL